MPETVEGNARPVASNVTIQVTDRDEAAAIIQGAYASKYDSNGTQAEPGQYQGVQGELVSEDESQYLADQGYDTKSYDEFVQDELQKVEGAIGADFESCSGKDFESCSGKGFLENTTSDYISKFEHAKEMLKLELRLLESTASQTLVDDIRQDIEDIKEYFEELKGRIENFNIRSTHKI